MTTGTGNSPVIAADSPPRRRVAARRRRRRAAALVRCVRAGGRLRAWSHRMLAAGRDELGQKGLVGIWMSASWAGPYPKNDQIRIRPAYPFIYHLFLSRYSADTYRRRIRGVSVSGAYQARDTCPECRVRVTEVKPTLPK